MTAHSSSPIANRRQAGVLLHITSLPGPQHKGNLGQEARNFLSFMHDCGLSVWQILPLGPTHFDGSPYQCLSTHAGNPELIDLDWLIQRGWLKGPFPEAIDAPQHAHLLNQAANHFFRRADDEWRERYADFLHENQSWLDDYSLYVALKQAHQQSDWRSWPAPLRLRQESALANARTQYRSTIDTTNFIQFVFFAQWMELRRDANALGIQFFGDMPIYVSMDSADVWAARDNFRVDQHGACEAVAGVPPDAFSNDGQLWGNPLFDWSAMRDNGYSWWIERMTTHLRLYDLVRIDHFRALESCWEIPATATTAAEGTWVKTPGEDLLSTLYREFDPLPVIAEDLGIITDEVRQLRDDFALPGMAVLQFAFDGDPNNEYLPHNIQRNTVIYTGTHDNNTTLGWYLELDDYSKDRIAGYLGYEGQALDMPWLLNRVALASTANLTVLPMQDLLSLDAAQRMNTPGTDHGNWHWRFSWHQIWPSLSNDLRKLVALYARSP